MKTPWPPWPSKASCVAVEAVSVARPVAWIRRPSAAFCSRPPRVFARSVSEPASQVSNIKTAFLARMRANHACSLSWPMASLHERLFGVIAQVVRNEIVAPVQGLAVAGGEEHEHVARAHLGGKVREDRVELGSGGVAIEDLGDDRHPRSGPGPPP